MVRHAEGGQPSERDLAYADTNLFITLFAGPAHPLHEHARDLFRRVSDDGLRLIVTAVVVAELVYVAESVLGWSRGVIGKRLTELLGSDGLLVPQAAALERALDLYGRTRSLDFADAYLAGLALTDGPSRVASFDQDLDRVPGVVRLAR